jgi:hypothetical protein
MNKRQQRYYDEIVRIAIENKWEVISDKYENNRTNMIFRCPKGHTREISPNYFKEKTSCRECSKTCPIAAERNFREKIKELGGEVIGEYINSKTTVKCICKNKHECTPRPDYIQSGNKMCPKCSNKCSEQVEEKFKELVIKSGGKVIGEYINSYTKIECICSRGHKSFLLPKLSNFSNGLTLQCCRKSKLRAEKNLMI